MKAVLYITATVICMTVCAWIISNAPKPFYIAIWAPISFLGACVFGFMSIFHMSDQNDPL